MYVYLTRNDAWTVGHYDPKGRWIAESDCPSPDLAAARVHYLNGGSASGDNMTNAFSNGFIDTPAVAVAEVE
jgi:hypothetical protein